MSHLVTAVTTAKFLGYSRVEDDFVDRLHYVFTTSMLIIFSITISWKQFGGKPIECMVPDELNEQYAEVYCWAKDTYFVPWEKEIPEDFNDRRNEEINYYQWVPFFLLAQAACFQLPFLYWKNVAAHSGIRVHHLVREATADKNMDMNMRKATVGVLATHIENALRFHRRAYRKNVVPHSVLKVLNLPYTSAYIASTYLLVKLLYLANCCAQFAALNQFMLSKNNYETWYGFEAFRDIMNGTTWEHTSHFPRVTVCDMQKRTMGNLQRFSFQCTLIINLLNEKIFVLLWMWYVVLAALSAVSFVYWCFVSLSPCFRRWFIVRHLELADMPFDADACTLQVHRFVYDFLHIDGVFVLRMINAHAGVMMGTDIIMALWRNKYELASETMQPGVWRPLPDAQTAVVLPNECNANERKQSVFKWSVRQPVLNEDKKWEDMAKYSQKQPTASARIGELTEAITGPASGMVDIRHRGMSVSDQGHPTSPVENKHSLPQSQSRHTDVKV